MGVQSLHTLPMRHPSFSKECPLKFLTGKKISIQLGTFVSVKKNHSFFAMFFLILFTPIQGCISPEIGDDFHFVITNTR